MNDRDLKSMDSVLVRYGEIGIKSDEVRRRCEQTLVKNLKTMLEFAEISFETIKRDFGRIFIITNDAKAANIAAKVFGVVSTSPAYTTSADLGDIELLAVKILVPLVSRESSFALRVRRMGGHEYSSRDVGVIVGNAIADTTKASVNLTNPNVELFIEIRDQKSYLYTEVIRGVGGMPLGTQGKIVALISGGIDSPVASWMMMKRGCEIIPLFYDCGSYMGDTARKRAVDCIKALAVWAGRPLHMVRITHEKTLHKATQSNRRLTCLLCKRMMYRSATELAREGGAHGIVTGESIGQVASQTTPNLLAINDAAGVPVFRPLVGMDKTDIMRIARSIGTYKLSTAGGQTSCKAAPKHPSTNADLTSVLTAESRIDIDELSRDVIDTVKWERIDPDKNYRWVLECFGEFK
ncbi:MAG TPA: tRNA uracil 4-sulfurtransferase ThiI [Candidatus Acidoferrales bacterium]|nr:tRNA uracil 4-sulfurtransferase ThiI [Candidatus Acidoferrales bacterium]